MERGRRRAGKNKRMRLIHGSVHKTSSACDVRDTPKSAPLLLCITALLGKSPENVFLPATFSSPLSQGHQKWLAHLSTTTANQFQACGFACIPLQNTKINVAMPFRKHLLRQPHVVAEAPLRRLETIESRRTSPERVHPPRTSFWLHICELVVIM